MVVKFKEDPTKPSMLHLLTETEGSTSDGLGATCVVRWDTSRVHSWDRDRDAAS